MILVFQRLGFLAILRGNLFQCVGKTQFAPAVSIKITGETLTGNVRTVGKLGGSLLDYRLESGFLIKSTQKGKAASEIEIEGAHLCQDRHGHGNTEKKLVSSG